MAEAIIKAIKEDFYVDDYTGGAPDVPSGRIKVKSKNDQLATAFNALLDTLLDVTKQANTIAQGDYSANIVFVTIFS